MFVYFRESEWACGQGKGRERGRQKESQAGSALSVETPTWGLNPRSVRSWPELKPRVRCLTNWATQAPQELLFLFVCLFLIFIFERQREREWGEGQREGHRGSKVGSTLTAENLMWGLNSRTMRSWPEPKSDAWLTHALPKNFLLIAQAALRQ